MATAKKKATYCDSVEFVLDVYRATFGAVVFDEDKYEKVFGTRKEIHVEDMSKEELIQIALLDLYAREHGREDAPKVVTPNRAARRSTKK